MGLFFHNFLAILDIEDNASEALQALMTTDSCWPGAQWNSGTVGVGFLDSKSEENDVIEGGILE